MKKILLLVACAALLALAPFHSLAAKGGWEFESPVQHSWSGTRFELHRFGGGNYCTACGYRRPEMDELNTQALSLIYRENVDMRSCWIMYDCRLYAQPSTSSTSLGKLNFGENYHVAGYQLNGNTVWILLKKLANSGSVDIGWALAENIYIDPNTHKDWIRPGTVVTVVASSGRGRLGPGTEYAYVETVHYGEKYVVLDNAMGSNGNNWIQICVDNTNVWVSSGLVQQP